MFDKKAKIPQVREVSPDELMKFRLSGRPGLLIKIKEKLFLAELHPKSTLTTRELAPSLCETCDCICKWCPKVNDLTLSIQLGIGRSFPDAVQKYGRIEKYDFITTAVEIFNKQNSNCIIGGCTNYSERNPADYEEQYFAETV